MNCVIDGTVNEKYLSLGLWGKPVIYYPISNAIESNCFDKVYVVTKSEYIIYLIKEFFMDNVVILKDFPSEGLIIDGRAANITIESMRKTVENADLNCLTNMLDLCKNPEELVMVDSSNNFELSLVLCNKRNKPKWLRKMILDRISEKEELLSNSYTAKEVCLVGHSQFDQWKVNSLCGLKVRNCGISGITIREYLDDIINTGMLQFGLGPILVFLGTNDIAANKSINTIAEDILTLLERISRKTSNPIFYLEILHINGRLDRSNKKIDELNGLIKRNLPSKINWISMGEMDDPYGNLNYKYTTDGLHLNRLGYEVLQKIIEHEVTI